MLSSGFVTPDILANENNRLVSYEYRTVMDGEFETCQARACFQTSETTRTYTEWVDVPCDGTGTIEIKKIE